MPSAYSRRAPLTSHHQIRGRTHAILELTVRTADFWFRQAGNRARRKHQEEPTMTYQPQKSPAAEPSRPPVAKLRIGLINASIWQRSTDDDAFYSVSFERRYRDSQG